MRLGEIVYDGPPADLTAEVLTKIYGEEDWSATIRKADNEAPDPDDTAAARPAETPAIERDRLAGLT